MKVHEILDCSFSSWYANFKKETIKSKIITIPPEVLVYLKSDDTVVIPKSSASAAEKQFIADPDTSDSEDNSWDDWDDADKGEIAVPHFPEFEDDIAKAIDALGGNVFPKLNWSSPKDASWIGLNGSLKCTTVQEVLLLLKTSEFVTHDLTQAFDACEDKDEFNGQSFKYELILRRWRDIHPGSEFRCFVKDNDLFAICQRHNSSYFEFIGSHKSDIICDIEDFHNCVLKGRFPSQNYVADLIWQKKGDTMLLDFNPFGQVTDSLMFTWNELTSDMIPPGTDVQRENEISSSPSFRYIKQQSGVQPSPYQSFGLPQDFVDLSRGTDPYKLIDFLKLQDEKQRNEDQEKT